MNNTENTKKPINIDWHPADIVAALRKKGHSLRQLSKNNGYSPTTISRAMVGRSIKAEQLIAEAIGVEAMAIWPSRYTERGERIVQRVRKDAPCNVTRAVNLCNDKKHKLNRHGK